MLKRLALALVAAVVSVASVPVTQAQMLPAYPDEPGIRVLGMDQTEGFFKYDLKGRGLDDVAYYSGHVKFWTENLIGYLYVLTEEDKGQYGVRCDSICVNEYNEVIGLNPDYVTMIYDLNNNID